MSDLGRKGLGEQVSEKVTPDSQKSTGQVASENITGAYDKVAGAVQPDSEKSIGQKFGDSTRSNADSTQGEGKTIIQQVSDTAADVAKIASDNLKSAADYVASSLPSDKK